MNETFLKEDFVKRTDPMYRVFIETFVNLGRTLGFINQKNFLYVIGEIQKISIIDAMPDKYRSDIGLIDYEEKNDNFHIMINATCDSVKQEMQTFNKLVHVIMHRQHKILEAYLSKKYKNKYSLERRMRIMDGYLLIEEAIAQEIADEMEYFYYQVNRPDFSTHTDIAIPGVEFQSNVDININALYQPIAIAFSKTLKRNYKRRYEDLVGYDLDFHGLCMRAFTEKFVDSILKEYIQHNNIDEFMNILFDLGLVYSVKQAIIDMKSTDRISNSKLKESAEKYAISLKRFENIANKRKHIFSF